MTRSYRILYRLLAGLVRRLYRVEVRGAENELTEGPLLVCANHTAFSDTLVLSASLHRQLRYFAKAELFRIPLLGWLITALGAFPVKRGTGDVNAIKTTLSLLEKGEPVAVFPQGTRVPGVHPRESEAKHGVGLMVWRSKATVLPVGISTKRYKVGIFRKTVVTLGRPIPFEELQMQGGTPEEYRRVSKEIFAQIADLVE